MSPEPAASPGAPPRLDPVAIGGVGGSGTRVVARIVEALGFHLGDHRNGSEDNLDHPDLDRWADPGPQDAPIPSAEAARAFVLALEAQARRRGAAGFGWKNPPTFYGLAVFAEALPALRYVHVVRHGLDVAVSRNHNQVRRLGHLFGIRYGEPSEARSAFAYWVQANDHAVRLAADVLGERVLVVRFEDVVADPVGATRGLATFLGASIEALASAVDALDVHPAPGIGRHRGHPDVWGVTEQDEADLARWGYQSG